MPIKLLLDTDIGSDIDDAVCLAYLLAQPECELLGVTTVTGQAIERAMMVDAMCRVAGRDVPIYPGIETPLWVAARQPAAPQAKMLDRWPHRTDFPRHEAIEFLRQTIRRHPHDVVLLAIGPLTNIATLFLIDPEIPSLLKSLIMMGGNFTPVRCHNSVCEWNILNDPHAARIVYLAEPPIHRSVGLDVTTHVAMDVSEVRERFKHPLLRPVLDFARVWFEGSQTKLTFHDPLAAAVIFQPALCGFDRGTVEVETDSARLAGFTSWKPAGGASERHEVAFSVDVTGFFDHYFSYFSVHRGDAEEAEKTADGQCDLRKL